jgi:hypothetical protein
VTLARVPAPSETRAAPATTAQPRAARDWSAWRGPTLAGLAAVVVASVAVGGYAVGHSNRSAAKTVATGPSATNRAPSAGSGSAARDFARGRKAGIRAGRTDGSSAGARAGQRAATAVLSGGGTANASVKGTVKNCPKTPIVGKAVVSSAGNMNCSTAARDQRAAFATSHVDRTPGGFTCHRLTARHYRCVNGNRAYRWDDGA